MMIIRQSMYILSIIVYLRTSYTLLVYIVSALVCSFADKDKWLNTAEKHRLADEHQWTGFGL